MVDNASKNTSNLELKLNKDEKIEKLEAELKEIKNKFNEAESIAKFGFWELDPVSLDRTWTDGLYKIVGYDPKSEDLTHYNDNKKLYIQMIGIIFMMPLKLYLILERI